MLHLASESDLNSKSKKPANWILAKNAPKSSKNSEKIFA